MGGVDSTPAESSLYFIREPLLQFYSEHNPDKMSAVDAILAGFGKYGVEEGAQLLNVALIKEYGVGLDQLLIKAKALYDYYSKQPGDLVFKAGQMIQVTSNKGQWWEGKTVNSRGRVLFGQFPSNYVKIVDNPLEHSGDDKAKAISKGNKQFRSILELITSEYKYVQDLQIVQDVFVAPLQYAHGTELTRSIFSSWTEMVLVHEQILSEMDKTLPEVGYIMKHFGDFKRPTDNNRIQGDGLFHEKVTSRSTHGLVDMEILGAKLDEIRRLHDDRLAMNVKLTDRQFRHRNHILDKVSTNLSKKLEKMSNFLQTATPYISNYSSGLKIVEQLVRTHPEAEKLVMQCEKNPLLDGLHLRDFLIKPVQRVCKYPLLIREIKRNINNGDAKVACEQAERALMNVADKVNEMVKQTEQFNAQILAEFMAKLRPSEVVKKLGIDKPSSRLFRHSAIRIVHSPLQGGNVDLRVKDNLYAFLFTDFILLTEIQTHGIIRQNKTTYKILYAIELINAIQATREETQFDNKTFSLVFAAGANLGSMIQWVFALAGEAECDGWVADLAEALSITAAARARRSAVLEQKRERARLRNIQEQQYNQMRYAQAQQQTQQVPRYTSVSSARNGQFSSQRSQFSNTSNTSNTLPIAAPQRPPREYASPGYGQENPQTMNQLMWELNYTMRNPGSPDQAV